VKLRGRGSFDFPVLGVAIWVKWQGTGKGEEGKGTIADARVVRAAVASHPQEVPESAAAIMGSGLEDEAIVAAAEAAYRPSKPMDNTDFELSWRKQMTFNFVKGALGELKKRR